jgi:HAD superfamily hydrolase (TIGR01509 family)
MTAFPGVPPGERALPRAVVFDCDGTIADTESISDRAWQATLAEHGYTPTPDDFRAVIGHPFPQNWAYFAARADLGERDAFRARLRERFIHLFDRELAVYPDAVTTVAALGEAGVPVAVASSSSRGHVGRVLDRAGIRDHVAAIVGADDVAHHKPDPTPYLAAAAALGVDPRECSAVEDTPVGLTAALGAGMFSIAVVRSHGVAEDLADAHRVVDEVTVEALVPDHHHASRSGNDR